VPGADPILPSIIATWPVKYNISSALEETTESTTASGQIETLLDKTGSQIKGGKISPLPGGGEAEH
jgi:hypothetical protein